jgi:hypothetical protein
MAINEVKKKCSRCGLEIRSKKFVELMSFTYEKGKEEGVFYHERCYERECGHRDIYMILGDIVMFFLSKIRRRDIL